MILVLHPDRDRILELRYRYPAGGGSSARVGELIAVLGEIEPMATASPTP